MINYLKLIKRRNIFVIVFFCICLFLLITYYSKMELFYNVETPSYIDDIFKNIMKFKKYTPIKISDKPWIVELDTFLSPEECDKLISLSKNWHLSVTNSNNLYKKDNNYRNSYSFNCNSKECLDEKIIKTLEDRINKISTLNKKKYEEPTFTKYLKGGFYKRHHDYIFKKR